ncbi:hypothetical protein ACVIIV_001309 [Bradyrhizobium sp. USDA 4354]
MRMSSPSPACADEVGVSGSLRRSVGVEFDMHGTKNIFAGVLGFT